MLFCSINWLCHQTSSVLYIYKRTLPIQVLFQHLDVRETCFFKIRQNLFIQQEKNSIVETYDEEKDLMSDKLKSVPGHQEINRENVTKEENSFRFISCFQTELHHHHARDRQRLPRISNFRLQLQLKESSQGLAPLFPEEQNMLLWSTFLRKTLQVQGNCLNLCYMDQKQVSWKRVLLDTLMMITWDIALNDPEDYIQCVESIKRRSIDCERDFLLKNQKSPKTNNFLGHQGMCFQGKEIISALSRRIKHALYVIVVSLVKKLNEADLLLYGCNFKKL